MAAPTPNTPMTRQQLIDLANAVNGCQFIAHRPFALFNPANPVKVNDRGAYDDQAVYNQNDQVTSLFGYQFVCTANGVTGVNPQNTATGDPPQGSPWQEPWNSCYRRMRDAVNAATTARNLEPYRSSVSGPWPCGAPSINYDKLTFYFEDTGKQESVSLIGTTGDPSNGNVIPILGEVTVVADEILGNPLLPTEDLVDPFVKFPTVGQNPMTAVTGPSTDPNVEGQFKAIRISAVTFRARIGGTVPVNIKGTFSFIVPAWKGWGEKTVYGTQDGSAAVISFTPVTDDDDPVSLVKMDTSNWPFGAFAAAFSGWTTTRVFPDPSFDASSGTITFTCNVDGTFQPGEYAVTFTTRGPENAADGTVTISEDGTSASGFNEWYYKTFVWLSGIMFLNGTITDTVTGQVLTPGVDNVRDVYKIEVGNFFDEIPSGLYFGTAYYLYGINQDLSGPQPYGPDVTNVVNIIPDTQDTTQLIPVFQYERFGPVLTFTTITSSTPGFWTGVTPPIRDLGIMPFSSMPWNLFPTTLPANANTTATENLYLGYIPPHTGDNFVTTQNALPAYDSRDTASWLDGAQTGAETILSPPPWKPGVLYPKDFVILDSNGNFERVGVAGRSGETPPAWPESVGGAVTEPIFQGANGSTQPGPTWILTRKNSPTPTWKPNTGFPIGETAVDGNRNVVQSVGWQKKRLYHAGDLLVDSNGNLQTANATGNSGDTQPVWAGVLNAGTSDGAISWTLTQLNATPTSGAGPVNWGTTVGDVTQDGSVWWKLMSINHRFSPPTPKLTPPIYPYFHLNPKADWQANHAYAAAAQISDSAGNTQTVTVAGTSGGAAPNWSSVLGRVTQDGSVQWALTQLGALILDDPNVDLSFDPANPTPQHPVQHPFSFRPQGWFIYRVALNRIPQAKSTDEPSKDPIPVEIGCVRNGKFVSFGTFNTGTMVDALWPVFTNTALAYKASEMVDVQAEILTCGLNYSTWGTVTYPMAAAMINDLTEILGRLN